MLQSNWIAEHNLDNEPESTHYSEYHDNGPWTGGIENDFWNAKSFDLETRSGTISERIQATNSTRLPIEFIAWMCSVPLLVSKSNDLVFQKSLPS